MAFLVVALAAGLTACGGGGDDSDSAFTGEEVTAAFEEAAGGYPFEEVTSLVNGADAYGPASEDDTAAIRELEDSLGESSLTWQVAVFDGDEPPTGEQAAKKVAFSSSKFEEQEEGVWFGDHHFAYVVNGNAVANGPVLDETLDDETLQGWRSVLDSLSD
jgi:hypothetical protein